MSPQPDTPHIDSDTANRIAEWSEWRGTVNQKLEDIPNQVLSAATDVTRQIDTLGLHLNRRLDDQDRDLEEMRSLQRIANGRTGTVEKALALLNAKVVSAEETKGAKSQDWRFRLTTIVAVVGLLISAAWLLTALHVI